MADSVDFAFPGEAINGRTTLQRKLFDAQNQTTYSVAKRFYATPGVIVIGIVTFKISDFYRGYDPAMLLTIAFNGAT
jgi:hypothetical protein